MNISRETLLRTWLKKEVSCGQALRGANWYYGLSVWCNDKRLSSMNCAPCVRPSLSSSDSSRSITATNVSSVPRNVKYDFLRPNYVIPEQHVSFQIVDQMDFSFETTKHLGTILLSSRHIEWD